MLVLISFALSFAAARLELFASVSGGTRTIVITVLVSAAAAWLFPKEEEEEDR
jgi:F0F1-type ATP synthase assembly protein I